MGEGEKDVVGSGSVLRGDGVSASRGADFLLVGMFMCGIWMLDGDGTAPDGDDGDDGGGGCGLDVCLWGVCFRGAVCQGLRRLCWCDWGCCFELMVSVVVVGLLVVAVLLDDGDALLR